MFKKLCLENNKSMFHTLELIMRDRMTGDDWMRRSLLRGEPGLMLENHVDVYEKGEVEKALRGYFTESRKGKH